MMNNPNVIHTEWGNIRLPKRKEEKYYKDKDGNLRRRK